VGELAVEAVRDPSRLGELGAAWDRLIDDRTPGAVFRSSAWLEPWWRIFGAGRELRLLVAWAGGRLAAALPCYRELTPIGPRLRLMGDGVVGSDYLGVSAAPADMEAACAAFARHLVERERGARLDGVFAGDALVHALERETARLGARLDRRAAPPCPYVTLDGEFSRWLATRPHGAGAQYLRRRRWLAARPGFRHEVVHEPGAIAGALETLFALHRARWAEAGGSGGIVSARVEAFHRAAARALAARGWARIHLLHVEGAPRAALYGFQRGPRFAFYQSGFDPSWRERSVGAVLMGAAIETAFAAGLHEFDLLHGDEPYKARWADRRRDLVHLRLAAGPFARAGAAVERAAARLRHAVGAALPVAVADHYRSWRARGQAG
jgi:CelD/BcsL family acetyltransferase involved in cellulose biosynthesis